VHPAPAGDPLHLRLETRVGGFEQVPTHHVVREQRWDRAHVRHGHQGFPRQPRHFTDRGAMVWDVLQHFGAYYGHEVPLGSCRRRAQGRAR